MNERSSRSHAIFTITVECSEKGPDGQHHVRMGKLHLVDLAVSLNILLTYLQWLCYIIIYNNIYTSQDQFNEQMKIIVHVHGLITVHYRSDS